MRTIKHLAVYLFVFAVSCCLTLPTLGQSADTGALSGTIKDTSGAVIPNAQVSVVNTSTGVTKALVTNSSGFYSAEALPSGDYRLVIKREGFETGTIDNIHLNPGQRREVSPQLSVGSVGESVTVQSDTLQVETGQSADSSTIDSKEISTLLVNGRNFQSLATLNPGVNNTNGNNAYGGGGLNSTTTLSIGGTGTDDTTYSIDGVYNMNTGNYINLNISPSMDAIAEFTVLKANYSARYGTASNSTILVDTKSGTSTYHGTVWDYFRNDAMDASAYYSQGEKTKLHQNIYGFSLGGPLQIPKLYNWDRKKKTFFFASDEWWANSVGNPQTAFVLTTAMRAGNLANSIGLPTGGLSLTAQGQALLAAEGKTNCILSATALNPACIDPTALAIVNAYQPTENADNPSFNYSNTQATTFSQIDHDYRIDHQFTSKESLTGRVMYEQTNQFYPYSAYQGDAGPEITDSIFTSGLNAVVRLTSSFGSNIVNTASAAETFDKPRLHASAAPIPSGATIGYFYPNVNAANTVPNIGIAGYNSIGVGPLPINASDGEGILNDDFSILVGKHSLQAGAFYIFGIKNQNSGDATQGSFSFSGNYTGSGAADYLLGLHSGYSQPSADPHYTAHYRSTEFYVQDDWQAASRLTINAGLRFFYYSPDWLSGPDHETSNFDESLYNAATAPEVLVNGNFATNAAGTPITASGLTANLYDGLVFNTTPGIPRGFYHDSSIHLAPRVGFAYALTNDKKTSVHAGYGIGYTRVPFQITSAFGQNPPGVTDGNATFGTFADPTAGVQADVPAPLALQLVNTHFRPSQVQNFSLVVEREVFRDAIFQVGYSGSLSRHLRAAGDINQVLPTSTPAESGCLAPGQAPSPLYDFDPCLNTNAISSDYIRPYKGYDQLFDWLYVANGNFNSLQSQFRVKRKDIETTLNYTWGRALGDANGGSNFRSSYSSDQNTYDIPAEYGPRNFNRNQIFTGNVIYSEPLHFNNRAVGELLGGWQISGIAIAQSGFPQTPSLSAPNTGLASRPDFVGPLHISSNRNQIFNASAFVVPQYGFFGNATNGSIPGPKEVAFNVALYKTFPITHRVNFQFRAEAFNIANHPSFGGVDTGIGPDDSTPGLVNSPYDPRILEMVGRISF